MADAVIVLSCLIRHEPIPRHVRRSNLVVHPRIRPRIKQQLSSRCTSTTSLPLPIFNRSYRESDADRKLLILCVFLQTGPYTLRNRHTISSRKPIDKILLLPRVGKMAILSGKPLTSSTPAPPISKTLLPLHHRHPRQLTSHLPQTKPSTSSPSPPSTPSRAPTSSRSATSSTSSLTTRRSPGVRGMRRAARRAWRLV